MHEIGIVRRLLAQVRQVQAAHGGGAVREIRVQLGPLSGVEAELLLSAFEQLRDGVQMPAARLAIDQVELAARCSVCAQEFAPVRFQFRCPRCGAEDTVITRGEGIMLESISLLPVEVEASG